MRYYIINNSLNLKIVGYFPQSIQAKNNCHIWDEPRFIEHHELVKIDFDPIVSNAILHKKSKLTDLISVVGMGFTRKLLLSNKLKEILETKTGRGQVQFFNSPIIYKDSFINEYWIVNSVKSYSKFIDIKKSTLLIRKRKEEGGTYLENIYFDSFNDLVTYIGKNELEGKIFFSKIYMNSDFKEDFFVLNYIDGGIKYLVSEKLKQEIEEAGCTGIEFQPSELSYSEWTAPGGERERVYGKA
ncbi:imm11 family protein [Epilithonimonas caeni]|uniref:imm11 family protein n=1 Tax=Epilithonimonas caeni TaxID=365343 RepID=UPI00041EEBE6|nr:DUF1629 domain-containing protein [Epilithonimonas caeni]